MAIKITKRPYKLSWSGNPVHYELTSATAATNAAIYFEIRLMFRQVTALVFTEVHRWPFYPTAGIAQISVHNLLNSKLEWQMPTWQLNEKMPQEMKPHTGEYYIEFREVTPDDLTPSWDASELDFVCTAIRGGINYFVWRGNNYWVNYHQVYKPFLTWQQTGRKAQLNERMFLGWLCQTIPPEGVALECTVRCKVTFRDGTFVQLSQMFYPKNNLFYYIPAGALQWGLAAVDPTKEIWYWELQVIIDDLVAPVQLSEWFKFELDNRWSLNDITLHYRNSLGGLDSVAVRGVLDQNLDYQFTIQNKTFKADYFDSHVISAQTFITDNTEQQTWKGDIGHLGKEEQDRLRDAQLLREVYTPSATKWFPVNIVTKNFKLKSTYDMRFTMPIEFTLAYEGAEYYTPKNINLGDGVFTSNVCLALLNNLLVVSKDFSLSPSTCEVTFSAIEYDPQDASTKFKWRLNGGSWFEYLFADLPLILVVAIDTDYLLEYKAVCTGDIDGKKNSLEFETYVIPPDPPPPTMPITVNEIYNSGTPGSTRQQNFEFNGVSIMTVLPENIKFYVMVYSHEVSVVTTGTETLNDMLELLEAAINAETESAWDEFGTAPAPGTAGFKPSANHVGGANNIWLVLNYQNQFGAGVMWV